MSLTDTEQWFGFLNRHKEILILILILSLSRTALSEKKPTVKPKSPEKSKPEEKDPEKSPTKKQEGSSSPIKLSYTVVS